MTRSSVSVVIPVWNGEATIGELLGALRTQRDFPPATEVIVVDNGSADATRDIVRELGVTLLEEPVRGPAAARNCGLRHARGDVVAHLDADMLPTRRWLAELVAPFADRAVRLVAGRTLAYRPRTGAERYVAASGLWEAERALRREPFPFAPSGNMAVRRDAALAIGGWAEDLPTGEDVDFSHRLVWAFGCEIAFAPNAVAFHRNRPSDEQLRRQARTYGEGAARLYLRYPEVVRWDARKSIALTAQLAGRTLLPSVLRVGRTVGLVSDDQLEFARYHRLWSGAFWRGFAAVYRRGGKG
jgi:glycosyltransferase involved in cell wall biosynthesis